MPQKNPDDAVMELLRWGGFAAEASSTAQAGEASSDEHGGAGDAESSSDADVDAQQETASSGSEETPEDEQKEDATPPAPERVHREGEHQSMLPSLPHMPDLMGGLRMPRFFAAAPKTTSSIAAPAVASKPSAAAQQLASDLNDYDRICQLRALELETQRRHYPFKGFHRMQGFGGGGFYPTVCCPGPSTFGTGGGGACASVKSQARAAAAARAASKTKQDGTGDSNEETTEKDSDQPDAIQPQPHHMPAPFSLADKNRWPTWRKLQKQSPAQAAKILALEQGIQRKTASLWAEAELLGYPSHKIPGRKYSDRWPWQVAGGLKKGDAELLKRYPGRLWGETMDRYGELTAGLRAGGSGVGAPVGDDVKGKAQLRREKRIENQQLKEWKAFSGRE